MRVFPLLLRLKRDQRGLALIEFALTLPIVLVLLLYGLETANLGLSILRVHQIAATSADNAARVRDSINEADVSEVLMGGKIVGERMDFGTRGRIVLSDVLPNGNTSGSGSSLIVYQKIQWQRCTGALNNTESQPQYGREGKGVSDNSLPSMGASDRQIAATPGSAMIFAEVTYLYKPLVSSTILGTPILRSEASFTVRERNSETLTGTKANLCTVYSA
ncbi:pilus assembly protein [Sphingomonas sp.]|jgi:hypothetical protein|uniref:TadE/TadG family type IV pilus assembly protein n=1 Tax=Sphingomonas sp. TaxID=28214 RepID=UPI00261BE9FA|nr:pilus assembly protein [Sphingomonas sp.]MDF2495129.1 hypothetical protein [Sphingomonas sp.]